MICPDERVRIAAEDGAASLTRILRRAELAGHDPHQVLHDAVADRPFDGARNLSNVVYSRIRNEYRDRLDPAGETFTDWTPTVDNPEWRDYLETLADAADQRAAELGREAAEQAAPWAIEAFGPVPTDSEERSAWERQAGSVAAVREFAEHTDADDALGPAPKPGQVEQYAAYRAAWRTLGRPEIDRDELELSDGQLRVRVRAHEREAAWAPRYVGNELAGTHQAAATYRQTAALRIVEADSATEPAEQERLRAEAAQAHALADTLEARAAELQQLDDARAHWLGHTAGTRAAAERAKGELAVRHVDDTEPEQQVTAEEWLAAHRAALTQDEPHRDITETDIHDADVADRADEDTLDEPRHAQPEVPDRDLREIAAEEPAPVEEDVVRVPSAAETSDAIRRANRALVEIRVRDTADAQEAAEYRAEELTRWHSDDQAAGTADADENLVGDEPVDQPVAS